MPDNILQANTDFGAQVIAAIGKPTATIHIGGRPLEDFSREELAADAAIPDQPERGQSKSVALFEGAKEKLLFEPRPESNQVMDPSIAANRAYSEALITQQPDSYDSKKEQHLNGTVFDATLEAVREQTVAQALPQSGLLTSEYFNGLDPVEQVQALQTEVARLDLRRVTPTDYLLIQTFSKGGGATPIADFNAAAKQVPLTSIQESMDYMVSQARREAEWDVLEIAAQLGWDSTADAIADIVVTDFLPISPLLMRVKALDYIAEGTGTGKAGGWKGWALGEYRNEIRKSLVDMTPQEFAEAARGFNEMMTQLLNDPVASKLITRYALVEQMEAVFTEDVFDGKSAVSTGDRWLGNFESLLEGLFSVMVVKNAGKGMMRTINGATSSVQARNAANAAGNHVVASHIDDMIQRPEVALEFGLEAAEATPALLPRPPTFVKHTKNLPQGTKDTLVRSERIRSEILETTDRLTGNFLTTADRTSAINKEITQLDLADAALVQGRMSSLGMLPNDTGFSMRVVVGESAEGGYKSVNDAMDEALRIDPHMDTVQLMRINSGGVLEPVFDNAEAFARAVTKGEVDAATAGRIVGGDNPDGSFYLAYDVERYWHTVDKEVLGPETFQSGGLLPRVMVAPNAKFGDEIYGNFLRAYMGEQVVLKNFEGIFEPFYKLPADDKAFVASTYEWMEDFGKNHGRAPDLGEVMAKYDGITEPQINALVAMRTGMDTMHELFNRRLYRDWQALGYKTARPADSTLPTFHGEALPRERAGGGMVLDPVTGKMVKMTSKEADDLYNAGGSIMELDMAVDAAQETGHKATRVLVREGTYEVGELSTKPLVYHPGYSMRFYDDPYYIVKEQTGLALNGTVRSGTAGSYSEAVRTAGTKGEAEHFMHKIQRADDERGRGTTYKVVRANELEQSESTLFQKQSIHREGRLFWDNRNFDRLPDVNGNRASLEDPVTSLERGIGQAARQLTHEDTLKALKAAWTNDYGKLLKNDDILKRFELKEIDGRLKSLIKNTVDSKAKQRLKDARDLIRYFRLIEGTDSAVVPMLREGALSIATTVNRITGLKSKRLESMAMQMDPLRNMRSAAFNLFMVFRPVRQALLQSSQIGYLAALKPTYVATPQFFKDAIGLRRGLASLRKSGYDDGFSIKNFAKKMNLTEKEYRVLIREFDRSGTIDLVDVHSFSGGAGKFRKTALPKSDSPLGTIGYKARQFGRGTADWFQKVGFNFGERNNLTFTYNLALKRTMERNNYKSLLEMSRKDWDVLKVEASNLALGMVRPNSFGYQSGALSVTTQFLGFSHKAALGLLAENPAISKGDAAKILFGTYLLYGANMFGARDYVQEQLVSMGVPDRPLGNTGVSLVDLISAGIIDNTFNMIGHMTIDDYKDIDLGFLAPGIDFPRMWDMQLRTLMEQPTKGAFGPFGNLASNVTRSLSFVDQIHKGMPDLDPVDKFTLSANAMLSGVLPAYNDAVKSYQAYQLNQWYSASGEALPLRPTMNTILARGLTGARSREEMAYYRIQKKIWEDKDAYLNIVQENHKFLSRMVTALSDGTMSEEDVHRNIGAMVNFWEEWPEGVRLEMLRDSMEYSQNDSQIDTVYRQLIEALKDKKVDSAQLDAWVDTFTDIPQDKREQLRMLLKESHESRVNVDATAFEEIQESQ